MRYDTSGLTPAGCGVPFDDYQLYNGLDCCLTYEVHQRLSSLTGNELIYDFERAMVAPAMEMMLRGLRVDRLAVDAAVRHLRGQMERLLTILNRYSEVVWEKPLNPRSSHQLKQFFYEAMHLPPQYVMFKGVRRVSANRESLEKLGAYFHAAPITACILAFRDLAKQVEFLSSSVDSDGRIRTSYNVTGTETGRWSSSGSVFGTGTNLQNFPNFLRSIFIADEGRKFAYCDLEQAESWIVGVRAWLISSRRSYLDAIQSGDLHTTVARLIWKDLPWTGDISRDRNIANRLFYRNFSYRDMAKRGGHGTNYFGTAATMAKHLKIPTALMEQFQRAYFDSFPEIRMWHRWVAERLQLDANIVTLVGRGRHFFGRLSDDSTLREAIAYEPQSVVGDLLNLAAWRIWKYGSEVDVRLMAQLHDAVLIDFPNDSDESIISAWIASQMRTALNEGGQSFTIPNDFASGWNWAYTSRTNPSGLSKDRAPRKRPPTTGLDRVIPAFH